MSVLFQIHAQHFIRSEQIKTAPASTVPSNNREEKRRENWRRGEGCCYYTAESEFFTHSANCAWPELEEPQNEHSCVKDESGVGAGEFICVAEL